MSTSTKGASLNLGVVQETLLTPLCARADQFGLSDAIICDQRAAELVQSIDYDFDRIRRFPDTLTGCAIRAAVFDQWIQEFLSDHDDVAVVLIGEGLDTTFDRNDDGRACWFEIDFPDVIELRTEFFEQTDRRNMIAGSVFDSTWIDAVRSSGCSHFIFQAAGVAMYLDPNQVRDLFSMVSNHFPGSTFVFDTCSTFAKRNSSKWEATVRTTDAVYKWGVDDPYTISEWDDRFQVQEVKYMMDYHRQKWTRKTRFWSAVLPSIRKGYQLNRAIFAEK